MSYTFGVHKFDPTSQLDNPFACYRFGNWTTAEPIEQGAVGAQFQLDIRVAIRYEGTDGFDDVWMTQTWLYVTLGTALVNGE